MERLFLNKIKDYYWMTILKIQLPFNLVAGILTILLPGDVDDKIKDWLGQITLE
jgi:hypothetical protein